MKIRGSWFRWTGTNKWGHSNSNNSFAMTVEKKGPGSYYYEVHEKSQPHARISSGTVSSRNDAQAFAEQALLNFIVTNVIEL